MKNKCLPEEIQERANKPFVFISYCHRNRNTYDRVKALVPYLRNEGINVVYDEGGLEPGTEIAQFENLILSENCKKVLVVCDKAYIEKVNDNLGGVWNEYRIISNDYHDNVKKYIPLRVDADLAIFVSKMYIQFNDDNEFGAIKRTLSFLKPKSRRKEVTVGKLVQDADQLCDKGNYSAALKKINKAIETYIQKKRTSKQYKAYLYNLKLVICLKHQKINAAVECANVLNDLVNEVLGMEKVALYYLNCALAHRMLGKDSGEYEDYAQKAYVAAKKCGTTEIYEYTCMYATALFETEQYADAYKYAKEALVDFLKVNNDMSLYKKNDYVMYMKIKANLAEISTAYCKEMNIVRKERLNILLEAQSNIIDVIDLEALEDEEVLRAEIYSIAVVVFGALKKFFSSTT